MNALSRGVFLAAALALAAGCSRQATEVVPPVEDQSKAEKPKVLALRPGLSIKFSEKTQEVPDCCKVPSRSDLFAATVKAAPAPAKAPVQQPAASDAVAEFLQPDAPPTPWTLEKQPRKPLAAPAFLENPLATAAAVRGDRPRLPAELPQVALLPRSLPAEAPLSRQPTDTTTPEQQPLPAKPLVRLPSVNVEAPVELPPLAKFQPERAPLTDVTGEVSRAAVLAEPVPVRATPEPFARFVLPDPFEFRATRPPELPGEMP